MMQRKLFARLILAATTLCTPITFGQDATVRVSPFPAGDPAPAPAATESKPSPRVTTNATSASHDCGTGCWTTGTFRYDPAGNVTTSGSETYRYDGANRLSVATLLPPDGSTVTARYTYDPFGNIHAVSVSSSISGLSGNAFSIDRSSNRFNGHTYDAAGNVTRDGSSAATMQWDGAGMMARYAGSRRTAYIYTADDERIATFDLASGGSPTRASWTIRGATNQVLRVFESSGGANATDTWRWQKDYVHADGNRLLASHGTDGTRHFHLDHLGTPRLITDEFGVKLAEHAYSPYGSEITDRSQDAESRKFTGHERDFMSASAAEDLDYMHRRFYAVRDSRFLSVDPKLNLKRVLREPQNWNRYAYAMGNPVKYTDPTGEDVSIRISFNGDGWTEEEKKRIIAQVTQWYKAQSVGKVYVFDAAKASHGGNFFSRMSGNYTSIGVSKATGSKHTPSTVYAGNYKDLPAAQRINAIANSIVHETVAHHFRATLANAQDYVYYHRDHPYSYYTAITDRYGTVADSWAYANASTKHKVTHGPIPIHPEDRKTLQQKLSDKVEPPDDDQ